MAHSILSFCALLVFTPWVNPQQQLPRVGHFGGTSLHLGSESASVETPPLPRGTRYGYAQAPPPLPSLPAGIERFLRRGPFSSPAPSPLRNLVPYQPAASQGSHGGVGHAPSSQDSELVYEYYEDPDSELSYQYGAGSASSEKPKVPPEPFLEEGLKLKGRSVGVAPPKLTLPVATPAPTKRPAVLHSAFLRPAPPQAESSSAGGNEDYAYYEEEYELHPPAEHPPVLHTKMTLSVSTQSSSTSTTTPPPPPPPEDTPPESGVVISVATTKSVSSGLAPERVTTPRVTFSRGAGSSVVVATISKGRVPEAKPSSSTPSPTQAPEYYEEEESYPDNYPEVTEGTALASTSTTTQAPSTSSTTPLPTTTTTAPQPQTPPAESVMDKLDRVQSDLANGLIGLLPPNATSATTTTTFAPEPNLVIKFEDNSAFLPADYKPSAPPTTSTPEPTTTQTPIPGLPLIEFKELSGDLALAGLLPRDYRPRPTVSTTSAPASSSTSTTETTTSTTQAPPPSGLESLLPGIKFTDASVLHSLLPPNFKPLAPAPPTADSPSPPTPTTTSSTTQGSVPKFVLPTRPGGGKSAGRPTTQEPPKAESPTPPKVTLKSGWPTRKTTAFTGWPTSSTEATTTVSTTPTTTTTTEATTTTTARTTTAPPPKRKAGTTCELGSCRMEATLRIVGGVTWRPEYSDKNTEEWKQLESVVKRELDGAYRSSGLAGLYGSIEVEGFNAGSILVDYFLYLNTSTRAISSDQVRSLFHGSLLQAQPEDEMSVDEGRLRFGRYTIDPRYTDFQVRAGGAVEPSGVSGGEVLIPQWGIAVLVIGLVSFMFVVVFGVTVLVGRARRAKKTNAVSLTQEMLNEFNKSHNMGVVGMDKYGNHGHGGDDLYNMDDVWNDHHRAAAPTTLERKPPSKTRSSSGGKGSYNMYDSWKTEWNGYYGNGGGGGGDSGYGAAPSRRMPPKSSDYDMNF